MRCGDLRENPGHLLGGGEAQMSQVHERLCRFELDLQAQRVTQGAVGVREAEEQIAVRVIFGGRDGQYFTITGEDVHLDH